MAKKKFNKKVPAQLRNTTSPSSPDRRTSLDIFFHKPVGVFFICVLFYGLVVWTFWPSLRGQFMFYDEYGYLLTNAHVNSGLSWANVGWALTSLEYSNWHPLTWMSHMLDFTLYGTNPWGHHLTNVLLHAGNAVLLFLVLKRMTGALWRSLIVAGLFALHPLRVESVAWISERKDVLSTFFWLLALWTYARFVEETGKPDGKIKKFYGLTFLFFVLGLMSKSMLVTFPCVLLLLDYWPLNRWNIKNVRRLILEKIPFFIIIPIISKLSYIAQQRGGSLQEMASLPLDARVENAIVSYARYLGKFFWPSNLCIYYPHPGYWPGIYVILAALLVAGVSICAWTMRRKSPYFFTGWFWFIGTAIPVIGLVQLCSQSIADRYTYVPIIGVTIALVWGLYALTKKWRYQAILTLPASGLLLIGCVTLTRYEIGFWKNEATVLSRAVAVTKDNYIALCNLGIVLQSTDPDQAFNDFQEAVRIHPAHAEAQRSLATMLFQRNRLDEAVLHFQLACDDNPTDSRSFYGLAIANYQNGNTDAAIANFQKALSINSDNVNYMNGLAMVLVQKNRFPEAVQLLKNVCAIQTNNPNAFNNLGIVFAKSGQFAEAITNFQNALNLAPDSTALQSNLAAAIKAKERQSSAGSSTNQMPAN